MFKDSKLIEKEIKEKIECLLPKTFYAGLPLERRIELLVKQWNKLLLLINTQLEEDIERLKNDAKQSN